jgi:hypothetical protein
MVALEDLDHLGVSLATHFMKTITDDHHGVFRWNVASVQFTQQCFGRANICASDKPHGRGESSSALLSAGRLDGIMF